MGVTCEPPMDSSHGLWYRYIKSKTLSDRGQNSDIWLAFTVTEIEFNVSAVQSVPLLCQILQQTCSIHFSNITANYGQNSAVESYVLYLSRRALSKICRTLG